VRCYLLIPAAEDPQQLLDPDLQLTAQWAGSEDGAKCDKCRGSGRTAHQCWSCVLTGTNSSCPACHGRVRWEAKCPVCRGTGETDAKPRQGVSAFPTAEALYHHLLAVEAPLVGSLVEVEADGTDDIDFYADEGSLLVSPTAIESTRRLEPDSIQTIRSLAER
jgi:hypothetical protein